MARLTAILVVFVLSLPASVGCTAESQPTAAELAGQFEKYSGARLVFTVAELPAGTYHDVMPELTAARRVAAARIAWREVQKLPPGFLGRTGLKTVGVFAACVSNKGDAFRAFDDERQGYRYYGIYNGVDAVAAAYYSDEQLPLTFHHETFHHIDRIARRGAGKGHDDDRLARALDGHQPYQPPSIASGDLDVLRRRANGYVLESTVSDYAGKNPSEDKAETARHLMSTLADSLLQVVERPGLPGSQRLLHVLNIYEQALPGDGPGVDWFVDVALGRNEWHSLTLKHADLAVTTLIDALPTNQYLKNVDEEIDEPAVRAAIRRVQPACVRLGGGSGVNVSAAGCVLTVSHVAGRLGAQLTVEFPDGRRFAAQCTAIDERLDLALCRLIGAPELPSASLAAAPPATGTPVVCIGQPGSRTPSGEPTDYQPFHVSTGEIRGFLDDRLGNQRLGRTKHDAWTYWGHSGSPLFNERGQIVAMHNSWDPQTAMRHAVTFEAIQLFLKDHRAEMGTD